MKMILSSRKMAVSFCQNIRSVSKKFYKTFMSRQFMCEIKEKDVFYMQETSPLCNGEVSF
jgi:hypothetical protein